MYILIQFLKVGVVEDPVFCGILTANTYLIYRSCRFFKGHLQRVPGMPANDIPQSARSGIEVLRKAIFLSKPALITGLFFGTIYFCSSLVLRPWVDNTEINLILGIFLFCANVVTGMALYSLLCYFRYAISVGKYLEINLWDRSPPLAASIIQTNQLVVIATSFICCLAIVSVMFSKFRLDFSILLFSVFSLTIMALAFLVPLIPITAQLRDIKQKNLSRIRSMMESEYSGLMKSAENNEAELDLSRFEALAQLHEKVHSINAVIPAGAGSIRTGISVIFLTMLPSMVEFILTRIG